MKRWTIKELAEMSDLKFAACILNERRTPLNPYSPLDQKLETAKNLLLRMDGYLGGWGSGTTIPADKILEILYRDGYHSAARLIECLLADLVVSGNDKAGKNGRKDYPELDSYDEDHHRALDTMTDEQSEAIRMALNASEFQECMNCEGFQK